MFGDALGLLREFLVTHVLGDDLLLVARCTGAGAGGDDNCLLYTSPNAFGDTRIEVEPDAADPEADARAQIDAGLGEDIEDEAGEEPGDDEDSEDEVDEEYEDFEGLEDEEDADLDAFEALTSDVYKRQSRDAPDASPG